MADEKAQAALDLAANAREAATRSMQLAREIDAKNQLANAPIARAPDSGIFRPMLEAVADNTKAGSILLAGMDTKKEQLARTMGERDKLRADMLGLRETQGGFISAQSAAKNAQDLLDAQYQQARVIQNDWRINTDAFRGDAQKGVTGEILKQLGPDASIPEAEQALLLPEVQDNINLQVFAKKWLTNRDEAKAFAKEHGIDFMEQDGKHYVSQTGKDYWLDVDYDKFDKLYDLSNQQAAAKAKDFIDMHKLAKSLDTGDVARVSATLAGADPSAQKAVFERLDRTRAGLKPVEASINQLLNGVEMLVNDNTMSQKKRDVLLSGLSPLAESLKMKIELMPAQPGTRPMDAPLMLNGQPMFARELLAYLESIDVLRPRLKEAVKQEQNLIDTARETKRILQEADLAKKEADIALKEGKLAGGVLTKAQADSKAEGEVGLDKTLGVLPPGSPQRVNAVAIRSAQLQGLLPQQSSEPQQANQGAVDRLKAAAGITSGGK